MNLAEPFDVGAAQMRQAREAFAKNPGIAEVHFPMGRVITRAQACEPWRAFPPDVVKAFERSGGVGEVVSRVGDRLTTFHADGRTTVEAATPSYAHGYAQGGRIEGGGTRSGVVGPLKVGGQFDLVIDDKGLHAFGIASSPDEQEQTVQRNTHLFAYTGQRIADAIGAKITELEGDVENLLAIDIEALEALHPGIAEQARTTRKQRASDLDRQLEAWRNELAGYAASPRKSFDLDVDDVRHFGLG